MFDFDETDLFHRCGYNKKTKGNNYITERFYTFNDGTTIPIMHSLLVNGLSNHIVLKTPLGFIPIENIKSFLDLFNKEKYLDDDTEWILPYLLEHKDIYEEEVNKLSSVLGKHWKRHANNEIIKSKKKVLVKNKE